jgi:dienelactone hydrolase
VRLSMFFARIILALASWCTLAQPSLAQPEFEVQETFLKARIDGRIYRLEASITKLRGAQDKLPVALILHGKDLLDSTTAALRPGIAASQARDLAERGWLAVSFTRRGFGRSDGPLAQAVSCSTLNLEDSFISNARDAIAVIDVLRQRPDADTDRIIAIGVSAGGSAAVALAASNVQGLRGVVNISGGLSVTNCIEKANTAVVAAFGALAARSKVPQLWVYADNDHIVPADLLNQMHEAALKENANIRRVSMPKLEPEGHNVFSNSQGRRLWLREMDNALREWNLPTHQPIAVVGWMKAFALTKKHQASLERYQSDPGHKAMSFSAAGDDVFWRFGGRTAKEVADNAVMDCAKKHQDCLLVMEGIQLKEALTKVGPQ